MDRNPYTNLVIKSRQSPCPSLECELFWIDRAITYLPTGSTWIDTFCLICSHPGLMFSGQWQWWIFFLADNVCICQLSRQPRVILFHLKSIFSCILRYLDAKEIGAHFPLSICCSRVAPISIVAFNPFRFLDFLDFFCFFSFSKGQKFSRTCRVSNIFW